MSGLVLLMLLVSWTSFLFQGWVLIHQLRQRATYRAEEIAGKGYVRNAASRAGVAAVYVGMAMIQALNIRIPGSGGLSPESLVVLSVAQIVWTTNGILDMRGRRKLKRKTEDDTARYRSALTEGNPDLPGPLPRARPA